jgi:hypothetical protein
MSKLVWLIGVVLTLAACTAPYFLKSHNLVMDDLIIGTMGITLTIVCEIRVKLSELEHDAFAVLTQSEEAKRIRENDYKDDFFSRKHDELRREISELAAGVYHVGPEADIYADDVRSIDALRKGEQLLSTCPISQVSKETALHHISDEHYRASIASHLAAAKRGVAVTRIYFFRSKSYFDQPEMKAHLSELANAKIDIRVAFLDKVQLGPEIDFLVFGDRKVSRGVVDPGTGKVWSARASIVPQEVASYIKKYHSLKKVATSLANLPS